MFDVVLFVTGQACYMLNFLFSFDKFDVVTGVVTGLTVECCNFVTGLWFCGWYDMFDVVIFVTGQVCYMLNFLFCFDV